MKNIIELKNVSKFYYKNGIIAQGFNKVNIGFKMGEFVVITGESGSGKSTLLNVISGLDSYSEGEMYINGEETSHYTERDKEEYRRHYIGNIFQTFNLINSYTVYQNIELVLLLNGYKKKDVKEKIIELIKKVDLMRFKNSKVSKLSGGQKQRVAIARALAKETPIIIADEPTGNLDSRSAKSIVSILSEISKEKLVIMVTHNYSEVEEYATRKIKMHDGQVIEDKLIKEANKVEKVNSAYYKPITFFNKIRLGIRNAFNIVPKFLLLLFIFMFISLALLFQYANYQQGNYEEGNNGYNYAFNNKSDKRIVIKKNDKTSFTEDDYTKINSVNNVDYVIKNDLALDELITLMNNDTLYINGYFRDIKTLTGDLDYGRMPENENEVVLMGADYNYIISDYEQVMNKELYFTDFSTGIPDKSNKYFVVGIKYGSDEEYELSIYGSNKISYRMLRDVNARYGNIKILFQDKYYSSVDTYFSIEPNSHVKKGTVYMNSDINFFCSKYNCKNKSVLVMVSSLYFDKTTSLKITNFYAKNTIKKLLGIGNYDDNYNKMFINPEDYNNLYDNNYYQSSVYVNNPKIAEETAKELQNLGLSTLVVKDTLVHEEISAILQIIQLIVIIITIVVLFFISYFIIKIILKSRNVYYSTIRMLGATSKVSKHLLIIDLMTVATLAYSLVVIFFVLVNKEVIVNKTLYEMFSFIELKNYLIFFIIVILMVYLLCIRYVRKTFKNTMINAYREEV